MSTPMNVLFIFTDEQRIDELGAYGPTPCRTPHIDRLAEKGMLFENAYTPCPLCSPARASVMTGQYPHEHGMTVNTGETGCNISELLDTPRLLPRRLKEKGYSCGYNGKWHMGTPFGNCFGEQKPAAVPSHYGFEGYDFPGHGGLGLMFQIYRDYLKKNGYTITIDEKKDADPLYYGTWPEGEEVGVPWFITDNTIELMETFRKRGKPFFMYHNFWGPHHPFFVPEKYYNMYKDVEIPRWDNYTCKAGDDNSPQALRYLRETEANTWETWGKLIRHKYAFMTYIDEQVGRMLDYLDESGLADNTMVIFSADHGDHLGCHDGLLDKGFGHFEETHRVPLIVRCPRKTPQRRDELVSTLDIHETILDAAGLEGIDRGRNRSLIGEEKVGHDYVVTEFHGLGNILVTMRTIRKGQYKYGWSCCGGSELYDLKADPGEKVNLLHDPGHADVLRDMKRCLAVWMQETGDGAFRQFERLEYKSL